MVDEQAVIRALTKASEAEPEIEPGRPRAPVITISRTMGSGGDHVAQIVADQLDIPCYCQDVLDRVAQEAKVHKSLLNKLHERLTRSSDAWLYSAVFGEQVTRDDYLHRLVTTIRGLYQAGGVIVGRGGHVILAGRDVLRVRVTGSEEACAKRLAMENHIDLADATRRIRESNKKRTKFMKDVFKVKADDPAVFDLIINTDHFQSYTQAADIIVQTMKIMGLDRHKMGTVKK